MSYCSAEKQLWKHTPLDLFGFNPAAWKQRQIQLQLPTWWRSGSHVFHGARLTGWVLLAELDFMQCCSQGSPWCHHFTFTIVVLFLCFLGPLSRSVLLQNTLYNYCTCMSVSDPPILILTDALLIKMNSTFISCIYRLTKSWTEQRWHNAGNRGDNRTNCGVYKQQETCWVSHSIIQLLLPVARTPAHLSCPRKRASAVPGLTTGGRCCHCTPHGRSGSPFRPLSLWGSGPEGTDR